MIIKREELIGEYKIRLALRNKLRTIDAESRLNERFIRTHLRKLLSEADTINRSTGINVLETLLKSIIPTIEDAYKMLTTSKDQRKSFMAHLVKGINDQLQALEAQMDAPDEYTPLKVDEATIKISTDDDVDDSGFIDIDPEEESEEEKFGIAGLDTTGRNVALETFNKIQNQIEDAFKKLSDENDRNEFAQYLVINIKLYSERWEGEIHGSDTDENPET